ncbi:MAG: class I SAM-dependent methyltransferase [Actinomycetia bacterium]|nr:class I SAM-dependent methyltransferase [Actinomycetes bacterium]
MSSDAYSSIARYYDRLLEPVNAPLRAAGLEMYPPTPAMTVLDVGCGTGAHLEAYVDAGATCTGIDASPAMLSQARTRIGDRATLSLGDATNLPYGDDSFDLIFTSMFLHELEPPVREQVLVELLRVVQTDGRILIIDYRNGSLRFKGKVWRSFATIAERIAGADHYRNWRTFLTSGGIEAMLPAGATIDRSRIVAGGNLVITLIQKTDG